jgi:hypothetical protein
MTTLTISGSSGDIPNGSAPLSRGLPPEATVGRVDWQSSNPVQINLRIRGLNHYANYTATSIAVVDHYDPFLRAVVREYFVIGGGQGASDISFVTGGSADGSVHGTGQAKIAIYSLGGTSLFSYGRKSWGTIGRILEKLGEISDAIDGPTNTVAYSVTDMGGGVVDPNSPGFIESRQRSLSRKVILQQDDYAFAGRGFDTPKGVVGDATGNGGVASKKYRSKRCAAYP